MNWTLIAGIVYVIILVLVCLRIVYDTRSNTKTLAYLIAAVFLPFLGIIFYFTLGINYRKRKLYDWKEMQDNLMLGKMKNSRIAYTEETLANSNALPDEHQELARLLLKDLRSPLTRKNKVKVLLNGENKFPEMLEAMRNAKQHIHIEYYIFEDDEIGRQMEEMMIQKVREGVVVRLIYDDFGSRPIRKKMVARLKAAGVQAFPFYKIRFILFANRFNYRNHRKIVVIDGYTAFTGGINVSDKYINNKAGQLYWRDTHIRIDGPGVFYLQYLFLSDWNFCTGEQLQPDDFLSIRKDLHKEDKLIQISASGPDSDAPSIMFSILQAIYLAEKEILITTPYFIPGESVMDALCVAARSGLSVKLLVPGVSDIKVVNAAAKSYYEELMMAGVEIYLYQKGFVHAKTLVADGKLSILGSANMDYRSFELNFEVNTVIYDRPFAETMRNVFYDDIKDSEKIDPEAWCQRAAWRLLGEKVARLLAPLM
jgi:cardiolipin synthase A/B